MAPFQVCVISSPFLCFPLLISSLSHSSVAPPSLYDSSNHGNKSSTASPYQIEESDAPHTVHSPALFTSIISHDSVTSCHFIFIFTSQAIRQRWVNEEGFSSLPPAPAHCPLTSWWSDLCLSFTSSYVKSPVWNDSLRLRSCWVMISIPAWACSQGPICTCDWLFPGHMVQSWIGWWFHLSWLIFRWFISCFRLKKVLHVSLSPFLHHISQTLWTQCLLV